MVKEILRDLLGKRRNRQVIEDPSELKFWWERDDCKYCGGDIREEKTDTCQNCWFDEEYEKLHRRKNYDNKR